MTISGRKTHRGIGECRKLVQCRNDQWKSGVMGRYSCLSVCSVEHAWHRLYKDATGRLCVQGVLRVCGQKDGLWRFAVERDASYAVAVPDCTVTLRHQTHRSLSNCEGTRRAQLAARTAKKVMRTRFWWGNTKESLKVTGLRDRRISKVLNVTEWEGLDCRILARDANKRGTVVDCGLHTEWETCWLVKELTFWRRAVPHGFTYRLVGCFVDWLVGWLVSWLVSYSITTRGGVWGWQVGDRPRPRSWGGPRASGLWVCQAIFSGKLEMLIHAPVKILLQGQIP